ncbi:MAG: ABC transporter permease [Phycisphaerae bacterium]
MIASLQRILAVMLKEFVTLLTEPQSRLAILAPPLVQLFVFGYAATYDLNNVPYAVYNEDRGELSRRLLARFEGPRALTPVARISRDDQIRRLIDSGEVLMVIRIDPDFTRDVLSGRSGKVQVIVDGRNSNTAQIALNYVRQIVADFNVRQSEETARPAAPARLITRSWYNPNLRSRWFIVPGMVGLITLVTTTLVTAMSVSREREQGTFEQLRVTPLRPIEIVIGKALPGYAIGVIEASVIMVLAVFWFGVPLLGSLVLFYTGLLLFLFSSVGVGLMISSLSRTMQQGLLGTFLFLVPAVILSGFSSPIDNMPRALQVATLANPFRHFLVILRGVFLQGSRLSEMIHSLWPMAVIGAVCMAAAALLFRRKTG